MKCFFVHTLTVDDLDHPTITSLLHNPAYCDIKMQFSRSSDDESDLLGLVNVLLDARFVLRNPAYCDINGLYSAARTMNQIYWG